MPHVAHMSEWSSFIWVISIVAGALLLGTMYALFQCIRATIRMSHLQKEIVELFHDKINKLPILVESLRTHIYAEDKVFSELIVLHERVVLEDYTNVYDLIEANARIHEKIALVMKVASKNYNTNLVGGFLYARDFILFYETNMKKKLDVYN